MVAMVVRFGRRICATSPLWLCGALLLGIGASEARADFIGYYDPASFLLTNQGGGSNPNGFVDFQNLQTLVLTGTNDGSGNDGFTDVTIAAGGNGLFHFAYDFTTDDDPQFQYAGYLLDGNFFLLGGNSPIANATGSVTVSVTAGELIGFRAGGDNQGGFPAVLTITGFAAPVPEPGTFQLLVIAMAAIGGGALYRRRNRSRAS